MLVDIQQLKDAEAALAERERQLSLIMDSVGFPITSRVREVVAVVGVWSMISSVA